MNCPEGYALAGGVCVADASGGGSGPADSQPYFIASVYFLAGTASGASVLVALNTGNLTLTTTNTASVGKAYVFPMPFTITRVVLQSDSGPGSTATVNLTLVAQPFVVGTPYTVAGFATLDSAIAATATGNTPMNANITAFAAGSGVPVAAGTGIAWLATPGGGVASTLPFNGEMQIYGVWG